jgi:hypothetical protein
MALLLLHFFLLKGLTMQDPSTRRKKKRKKKKERGKGRKEGRKEGGGREGGRGGRKEGKISQAKPPGVTTVI